jgi:transcriptional antiterminator NusG
MANRSVLVVEDDVELRQTIFEALSRNGFDISEAGDGVEALEKIQIKRGQRKTINEKIFPGYMLVKLELTDDAWLAVRTTQGVTGFVGIGNKPTPLPKHEVQAIQKYMKLGAPQYKADYVEGEAVKIVDGPFNEFLGTVNSIDEGKGKVTVLVSIFGRETPVELDFLQVQKV